jgi:hypothetical protein
MSGQRTAYDSGCQRPGPKLSASRLGTASPRCHAVLDSEAEPLLFQESISTSRSHRRSGLRVDIMSRRVSGSRPGSSTDSDDLNPSHEENLKARTLLERLRSSVARYCHCHAGGPVTGAESLLSHRRRLSASMTRTRMMIPPPPPEPPGPSRSESVAASESCPTHGHRAAGLPGPGT